MRIVYLVLIIAVTAACDYGRPQSKHQLQRRVVQYHQNGATLNGVIVWDVKAPGLRPGVLVVHEWWGHDEHAERQAGRLAEEGYVAFALDMYGDGKHAEHPEDAQKFMAEATKDPAVIVARFNAARDLLMQDPHVDKDKIGAVGYCFGGGVVLNMARLGQDLDAVVSMHGALAPGVTAKPGTIKARILVLTGADDPFTPPDVVEKFRKEMTDAGANFRIISYPGVKHSFTNDKAETHGMKELAFDPEANRKSFLEMMSFFREVWPN